MNYDGDRYSSSFHNRDLITREKLPCSDDYAIPRRPPDDRYNRNPSPVDNRVYDDFVSRDYSGRDSSQQKQNTFDNYDYRNENRDNMSRSGNRDYAIHDNINRDNTNRDNMNRDDMNRDNMNRDDMNRDNMNRDNMNRNDNRDSTSRGRSGRDELDRDNRRSRSDHLDENNRRYRSHSRSRSRSGSRERSRRSERDKRRRDDSRESRSRRSERDGSRNSRRRNDSRDRHGRDECDDYRSRRSRDENKEYLLPPSQTVIVQYLSLDVVEADAVKMAVKMESIEDILKKDGMVARSVAIIRERNGESRGFAFVEFSDVSSAQEWIKITKRSVSIKGNTANLNFSKSKRNTTEGPHPDWFCSTCNALNFGSRIRYGDKRFICFKCKAVQTEIRYTTADIVEKSTADNQSSGILRTDPCNVLMLRGIDFSTSEDTIRMEITKLTSKPIYDVRLIRDKITDMSRGFAFVELGAVEDAQELLKSMEAFDPPFEIDNRRITVGYARHGYNAPITGKKNVPTASNVSKQTVAQNAVAQASATKATAEYSQIMADSYALSTGASISAGTSDGNKQDEQNSSSYVYDAQSGYYYDATTGLYYDPNTGYYYNGTTQQWLYWNGIKYEAMTDDSTKTKTTSTTAVQQQPSSVTIMQDSKSTDLASVPISGQKPKNARKIAKDMERWAKKLNNQSEARKVAVKQAQDELRILEQKEEELRKKIVQEKTITGVLNQQLQASKDGVRSLFVPDNDEEGSVLKLGSALTPSRPQKPRATSLVADLPDEDDDVIDESRLIETTTLACLLCQRKFPSKENLMKHVQISQLHKENLEKFKQKKAS